MAAIQLPDFMDEYGKGYLDFCHIYFCKFYSCHIAYDKPDSLYGTGIP